MAKSANPAVIAEAPATIRLLNEAAKHPLVIAFAEREGFGVRAGVATTDYAVARFLGISPQYVSMWRTSGRGISAGRVLDICKRLEMSDAETMAWLCDFEIERAKAPDQRKAWERFKRDVTRKLTAVILPFVFWLPTDAEALADQAERSADVPALNIMLNRVRRWLRAALRGRLRRAASIVLTLQKAAFPPGCEAPAA